MPIHGAKNVHIEPKDMADGGHGENEATLRWAEDQYLRALQKLNRISPVTSLTPLQQGDVLISSSGNARVVLAIDTSPPDAVVMFLSRLRSTRVTLETAILSKIDMAKLDSIVRRKTGNPLEKFSSVAKGLEHEHAAFHNVKVLLQSGILGGQVRSALMLIKKTGAVYADVDLWVSTASGEIIQIGGAEPNAPCRLVTMSFNCLALPTEEYIKSARFDRDTDPLVKKSMLSAAVLANTLENARNLLTVAKTAGK